MLKVEKGNAGLWYVTSDVIPGLLVAGDTQKSALEQVGQALADIQAAMDAEGSSTPAPRADGCGDPSCKDPSCTYGQPEPANWQNSAVVPLEPTLEMWAAAGDAIVKHGNVHHDVIAGAVWKAMLSAAPSAAPLPQSIATEPEYQENPVCPNCDHDLSCAHCGVEIPDGVVRRSAANIEKDPRSQKLELVEGGLLLLLDAVKAGDPQREIIWRIEEELRVLRGGSRARNDRGSEAR